MTTSIPAPLIEAAASILQPYGVNLTALLKRQDDAPQLKPLEKAWLTSEEATYYTGLGRCTLWRAAKAGKVKARKLSAQKQGRVLFERASLDAWLQSDHSMKTGGR